ncbi:methyltransferase-like protein 6 [Diachasma alloeum]|uniref:methyltransferase-like protein 6 n=1 Tax=Diachasma alloeum TaxID=454923 RepID=UPI00073817CB|nr:methyltransferase-like protein 6 [Diachasma alloeum]
MESTEKNETGHVAKRLTEQEVEKMKAQDSRLVPQHRANLLEKDAKKYWDLFYKRNTTSFFKDRHWTTREFQELLDIGNAEGGCFIEVGCGVGNLIYPLLEDGLKFKKIYACDLSPRAVDFVKEHKLYDPEKIRAFQADVTADNCFSEISSGVDVATLVFVLSAIHPQKFQCVAKNLFRILKRGGTVLFRDYGLYDMAQLRFKPGHKIADNFYMRQDGTRSYYFATSEVAGIFKTCGFEVVTCTYVQRRTINLKEKIDVPRIFVQATFKKP